MKNSYISSYDELAFSEEEKGRIKTSIVTRADELLEGAERDTRNAIEYAPVRKRPRFVAAAAALLALALGCGGIAYATGSLDSVIHYFDEIFNGPVADTEIVEKIGRPIGASSTDAGITITAEAVIGDRSSYAIIYKLQKEDGTPFDAVPYEGTPFLPYSLEPGTSSPENIFSIGANGMSGESYFYDADPDDAAIQYVEKHSFMPESGFDKMDIIGSTIRADFNELVRYDENFKPAETVSGNWTLRFKLDYEDTTREVDAAGRRFSLNGGGATMQELHVSSLSLNYRYTADEAASFDREDRTDGRMSENDSKETNRLLNTGEIVFTMKDGTRLFQRDSAGGSIAADGRTCTKTQFLDTILNLDELESITIGGTVFKVAW